MATRHPAPAKKVARKVAKKVARKTVETTREPVVDMDPPMEIEASAGVQLDAALKQKLVRDSFTIPKGEYDVLGLLKTRLTELVRPTKKGELIRAGIAALGRMSDADLLASVNTIPSLATGRPRKDRSADGKRVKKKA